MYSAENFGSLAQRKKNFSNAMMSKFAAGMPRYSRGLDCGVSRTVLAWHTAQLRKMRSMPVNLRFDMPTGRSLPSSKIIPSDA